MLLSAKPVQPALGDAQATLGQFQFGVAIRAGGHDLPGKFIEPVGHRRPPAKRPQRACNLCPPRTEQSRVKRTIDPHLEDRARMPAVEIGASEPSRG